MNNEALCFQCSYPHDFFVSAKNFIRRTLAILKDLIEVVSGEATKSKTIVYKSVQESLHTTLALFPVYIHEQGRHHHSETIWKYYRSVL